MKLFIEASVVSFVMAMLFVLTKRYLFSFRSEVLNVAFTGFVGHLLFELVQLNKYYCKHGNACRHSY